MDSTSPITRTVIECDHCGRSRLEWTAHALTADQLRSIGQAALDRWYVIASERKRQRGEREREA